MEPVTIFAFYFILWWLTLFCILPFGVKTQAEESDVTLGTVGSAPSKPMIVKKMIITTIVSAIILALIIWVVVGLGVGIEDIPFIPDFSIS